MWFAAILVVGRQLWRKWRGMSPEHEALAAVNPVKLVTISLLVVVTLLLIIPVAAWLGFVLVVYSPLLGL